MDRQVTSPTWDIPAPCKQALRETRNLAVTWSMASGRVMSCLLFWWKSSLQLMFKEFIEKKDCVLLTLCMLYYFQLLL